MNFDMTNFCVDSCGSFELRVQEKSAFGGRSESLFASLLIATSLIVINYKLMRVKIPNIRINNYIIIIIIL